ncbi:MAG: phosphatidate cytidylyltransferase [Betaproteobacteria bacterium]|nr:phosphatidate cytidylyltransferase [Betaproteobacteria bacterium]
MLKQRVITAVLLLLAFLSAIFLLPLLGWIAVATLVASLAAWEWGGLMLWSKTARVALGLGTAAYCLLITLLQPALVGLERGAELARGVALGHYLPAALFWIILVPFWLRQRWPLKGAVIGLAVGAVVLLPTWLALVQLRQLGPWTLLGLMAVVWIADIAAYFSGRAFGKHKLAPQISPGKTWEGAAGAVVGVVAYGLLLRGLNPALAALGGLFGATLALLLLTSVSIAGDLFESLLKRQAGIKDSSQLLPGHGGVLDRIDSLTSTLPLVAVTWLFL